MELNVNSTAAALRLLAKKLEDDAEDTPDFIFCIVHDNEESTFQSTHRALMYQELLLGVMRDLEFRMLTILNED